ncbi:MAG: hypothetical protein ACLT98_10125 [Eggerthellaceae bacterium]
MMAVLSATTAQATYSAAEKQALFTNDTYQNSAAQSAVAVIDAALEDVRASGGRTKRLPPWTRRCRPTRNATGRVLMTFASPAGARLT